MDNAVETARNETRKTRENRAKGSKFTSISFAEKNDENAAVIHADVFFPSADRNRERNPIESQWNIDDQSGEEGSREGSRRRNH